MPPVVIFMIAGAGLYAGAKWFAKEFARHADEAHVAADEQRRRASRAAGAPRDLGPLEFDPVAKVYRPRETNP